MRSITRFVMRDRHHFRLVEGHFDDDESNAIDSFLRTRDSKIESHDDQKRAHAFTSR